MSEQPDRTSSAATTVPENKDAPCNICGRGWPYHHDACAYKQTVIRMAELESILDDLCDWAQHVAAPEDNGIHSIVERAEEVLSRV